MKCHLKAVHVVGVRHTAVLIGWWWGFPAHTWMCPSGVIAAKLHYSPAHASLKPFVFRGITFTSPLLASSNRVFTLRYVDIEPFKAV